MRRQDYNHWSTGLPKDSDALADLDDFCTEMGGIERSEATRFILIAWSKSRRSQFGQMWGFGSLGAPQPVQVQAKIQQESPVTRPSSKPVATKNNTNGSAAAAGLTFDDDDE